MSEKTSSLPHFTPLKRNNIGFSIPRWALVLLTLLAVKLYLFYAQLHHRTVDDFTEFKGLCTQSKELIPEKNADIWSGLGKIYSSEKFSGRAVKWLSGAVQIKTESYDNMDPVGLDPRWEAFKPFHEYLSSAFPEVHATLALTKVNTYGLVYEWKGSSPDIKPLLLAAHQDVVPVHPITVGDWSHPPYSGHFDGEKIWGRGSVDDKSGLIGILSAITTLIENGFQPTRTVVLAFGFDEEASGTNGAGYLATYLLETYGKNAFAMIVDEGAGFVETLGATFATPGIAEKGYIDMNVVVNGKGGHSSVPPAHTSIGILSSLLVHYENHPPAVSLATDGPIFETIECLAAHAPDLPPNVRKAVKLAKKSSRALRVVEDHFFNDVYFKSLAATTQAIDLITGGVKTNALPELASAVINHRIALDSSIKTVRKRAVKLFQPVVEKFNLSFTAWGADIVASSSGYGLTIGNAFHEPLEPAPITPTGALPYKLLSGTIKAAYNTHRLGQNKTSIVVAPGIMSGNTDTRYYWDLSEHIFRYDHYGAPAGGGLQNGIHTVNEFMEIDAFLEMIRFFAILILNADESDL